MADLFDDLPPGFVHRPLWNGEEQHAALAAVRAVVDAAPFYTPAMPRTGKPFSVAMTNCGPLGWVSDRDGGYRYQPTHPVTGAPWPPIPEIILAVWQAVSDYPHPPEACLINYYAPDAKLGLHQDADEDETAAPVVSLSLGDDCRFRLGGAARNGPTRAFRLVSGDLVVLGGASRLAFHGVDRIYAGTSPLLRDWFPDGGRINLTLRRVTRPT
jgi:alkylated DNA repair protein (DNA oxidative demethylase)